MQVSTSENSLPLHRARAENKHVSGLAFLRGLAALSVALYHFTGEALPKLHIDEVYTVFSRGYLGVDVFFVISGFIIPYSLLGKGYTPRRFFNYMAKRIVRINPPAYLALLLVLAQWYLIDHFIAHKIKYTAGLSGMQIVNNLLFTVPFTQYKWVIGIFWTLAIEFQFYIIIGLLFNYLFEKKHVFFFVGAYLLFALGHYLPFKSPENFFTYSTLFAMGGLTLFKKQERLATLPYLALLLLFGGICYFQLGFYIALVGVATALAIEYINLNNAFARFMGKISYSFYLIHVLIGNTCEFAFAKFVDVNAVANRLVLQVACLAIAIGAAYVFYLVVERPFMKLASRLKT